jgi:hypothetical protein
LTAHQPGFFTAKDAKSAKKTEIQSYCQALQRSPTGAALSDIIKLPLAGPDP